MLKCKVIGMGAAGNKAAIALIKQGVVAVEDILLINSTLKDVPEEYRSLAIELTGSNGCAKERKLANDMTMQNLQNGELSQIDSLLSDNDAFALIVTSAEGGTGSGSSTVLARYIDQVLGRKVHLTVFCGFEDDARGLKNTIDWFSELSENYIVDSISNKKFLDENFGNKRKAEAAANLEFCERVQILLGQKLIDGEDNIDDTDLIKIVTTPGYMDIIHGDIGKPKNVDEFNKAIKALIDGTRSYETAKGCQRYAVIAFRSDKIADAVGDGFDVISNVYGEGYEKFTHTQDSNTINTVDIIVSGLKMPLDIINEVYDDYKDKKSSVDVSKDEFFQTKFDTSSDEFDMSIRPSNAQIEKNKSAFFGKVQNPGKFENTKKSEEF